MDGFGTAMDGGDIDEFDDEFDDKIDDRFDSMGMPSSNKKNDFKFEMIERKFQSDAEFYKTEFKALWSEIVFLKAHLENKKGDDKELHDLRNRVYGFELK